MSIISSMKEILPELTRSERKAAEYIISRPIDVVRYASSDAVGSLCGCSRNTIIRLAQKMGYKGFYEFKIALAKEMNNFVSSNTTLVSDQYIHAIEDMRQLEQSPVLRQAAKLLENADHIYSYGLMHSEFSARQFMFRMARNGYSVHSIDPVISLGDYSHLITNRDVVVIFSISGGLNHNSLVQECESVYSTGHPNIILFTMTDFTPVEKFADVTIKLPCVSRMTSEVIIDDAPIFYIGIELLLNVLTQK